MPRNRFRPERPVDEFADFIEEDDLEDEDERQRHQEEMEVARPRERGFVGVGTAEASGLDKDALDDMQAIFGNGEEYDWALALEEEAEAREMQDQQLELKDVFEPSQLAERLLTDEDNEIRSNDVAERYQLDRKPYKHLTLSEKQFQEETEWIANLLWPKQKLPADMKVFFYRAVGKVLEFICYEELEVPYIFQHRKDFLIRARKIKNTPDPSNPNQEEYSMGPAERMLTQDELWRVVDLDLSFRAFLDRKLALERTYDRLKSDTGVNDDLFETMVASAVNLDELQDLQDYLYFTYSAEFRDLTAMNGTAKTASRRVGGKATIFDRVRKGKAYNLVRAYGITADQVALNALREGRKQYTEDEAQTPIDMADSLVSEGEFSTGDQVLLAARQMFAEELAVNPRMRKYFRGNYYVGGCFSCQRTEKGLRKIDEQHDYYEFKYLKRIELQDLAENPSLYLKMLKAEEEGLIQLEFRLLDETSFRKQLFTEIASDNYSEIADAWNDERQKVIDLAFDKLHKVMVKGIRETFRTGCQDTILKIVRDEYAEKLDQAPYNPKGMVAGTVPRVLALSSGESDPSRGDVFWAWVEEDGRVVESGKFRDLVPRNKFDDRPSEEHLIDLIDRRKPDVIGVSGFAVETHKLVRYLRDLVSEKGLHGAEYEDTDTGDLTSEPLEVVVVNDEVARLYKDSTRAQMDHPGLPPILRYCVALAKYLQSPMKEYAALGDDIISLRFHPCQQLLNKDKMKRALDSSMVDMVNLCGVDINEAIGDAYVANLLPYVCGLGPRKATGMLHAINQNGGMVNARHELVGDPTTGHKPACGPKVWNNCASFLYVEYDSSMPDADYLDNTRIHPQDYELARKMAADALGLDEEDVKAEVDEAGPGAVIRKLIKDDDQEKINELELEAYAAQLEIYHATKKRATLETIRAELIQPYEELRKPMRHLTDDQIFVMFSGETRETLYEGAIVSVTIRVVKDDFIIAKLDSGIEGRIEPYDCNDASNTRAFQVGQTVQAKVLVLDKRDFMAKLSLREDVVKRPTQRRFDHNPQDWDTFQELQDKEELKEKDKTTGRVQRVIKHPLFHPFNSVQAEEYLGSQALGDAVIRPSSKGHDHLAVTWKVADGVYQHIDVLELQKENEFSLGKQLRIGSKYNYSDLDELIVEHVKAMARKVSEMMQHEKFRAGGKTDTGKFPHAQIAHLLSSHANSPNRELVDELLESQP